MPGPNKCARWARGRRGSMSHVLLQGAGILIVGSSVEGELFIAD